MRGEMERKRKPEWVYPQSPPDTPVRMYSITGSTLVNQVLLHTAVSLCRCQSVFLLLMPSIICSLLLCYSCSGLVRKQLSEEVKPLLRPSPEFHAVMRFSSEMTCSHCSTEQEIA